MIQSSKYLVLLSVHSSSAFASSLELPLRKKSSSLRSKSPSSSLPVSVGQINRKGLGKNMYFDTMQPNNRTTEDYVDKFQMLENSR